MHLLQILVAYELLEEQAINYNCWVHIEADTPQFVS